MKKVFPYLFFAVLTAFIHVPCTALSKTDAPDYSKYILTPPAPDTPRINGPKVYGARPDADFLFRIPATGIRPMSFEAKGLPKGLKLDPDTGIIRGKVRKGGIYNVSLKATNKIGTAERVLKIVIGDQLALTPPMGWSSWNCYGTGITQERAMATAQALLKTGLADYGYSYINIDSGWQGIRDCKENALQPNSAFPDMKALGDYLHENGLKFGIYSSPWMGTYTGHLGSSSDDPEGKSWWVEEGSVTPYYQVDQTKITRDSLFRFGEYSFARQDARQWAEWGVDFLKYDWNAIDAWWLKDMRSALLATGRDIILSLSCHTGYALGPVLQENSELWRTAGGDLKDSWDKIVAAGIKQERWAGYTRPGSWPDADMLVLGKIGWGRDMRREFELHWTHLTADEQYTHMSLWALLSSPLIIGCDLTEIDDFTLSLLTNNEVIDVNQDPLAFQAAKFSGDEDHAVYIKPLEDGSVAIGLFNFSDTTRMIGFRPHNLGLIGQQTIRDIWRQKDIAKIEQTDWWETPVRSHGVKLLKVSPKNPGEKLVGYKPFSNKITKETRVIVDSTEAIVQ
jgi:alpha-galactosidase